MPFKNSISGDRQRFAFAWLVLHKNREKIKFAKWILFTLILIPNFGNIVHTVPTSTWSLLRNSLSKQNNVKTGLLSQLRKAFLPHASGGCQQSFGSGSALILLFWIRIHIGNTGPDPKAMKLGQNEHFSHWSDQNFKNVFKSYLKYLQ